MKPSRNTSAFNVSKLYFTPKIIITKDAYQVRKTVHFFNSPQPRRPRQKGDLVRLQVTAELFPYFLK